MTSPPPCSVDKDLKSVVYRAGIAHGTVEDWDYLWNWYEETDDPYEKRLCLGALAESTEPWVLSRYIVTKKAMLLSSGV